MQLQIQVHWTPQSDFCMAPAYPSDLVCSEDYFIAESLQDLNNYNNRSGLVDGEYKNLKINFSMQGGTVQAYSPCTLKIGYGFTHTAQNICLTSQKNMNIGNTSIFQSEKIHILPQEGLVVSGLVRFNAQDVEIFSSGKIHINSGVRLDVLGPLRMVSTSLSQRIRFGAATHLNTQSLNIIGHYIINFTDTQVVSTGDIQIESRGTESKNRVGFFRRTSLKGQNVTIQGGNGLIARKDTRLRASSVLKLEALSCSLSRGATLEGRSLLGSCTVEGFNQIPYARIQAHPISGTAPLTTMFDASSSSDPDGSIEFYQWIFPDQTILAGVQVEKTFTTAGSHIVRLLVTDNGGASEETEVVIEVEELQIVPVASLIYSPIFGGRSFKGHI